MSRFVIEGMWSGYRAAQRKPCYRRVVTKRQAEAFKISCVGYSDGTTMDLSVRPCAPREKVQEMRGYDGLLRDFEREGMSGYCSVDALMAKQRAKQEAVTVTFKPAYAPTLESTPAPNAEGGRT